MLGGEGWKVADVKVLTADAVRSIAFELNESGAERFGPMTERNIGRPLAMIVDGKVYSAPNLRSRIEGSGQITGTFSQEDAEKLAAAIKEPGRLTLRVAAFVTEVADPQVVVKELKEKGPGGEVNK
jgi:preprotein translocase subunit SecD